MRRDVEVSLWVEPVNDLVSLPTVNIYLYLYLSININTYNIYIYIRREVEVLLWVEPVNDLVRLPSVRGMYIYTEPYAHRQHSYSFSNYRNTDTTPQRWRTRKRYTTQDTKLPYRGAC